MFQGSTTGTRGEEDVEAERGKEDIATPGDRDFASACRLLEAGADDHTIAAALAAVRGFDTKCPGGYLPRTASSPNTRAAYGGALRRLAAWLDGRPLNDRTLAAYLDSLREASTRDVQLAGGWKNAGTVARYAARVGTNGGAP